MATSFAADRRIGRAAVLVTILLILVFAATVGRYSATRLLERLGWRAPSTSSYAPGDTIDLPADVYGQTPFTLVLFARSSCVACQAAEPFHRQLVDFTRGRHDVRLVMSSPVAAGQDAAEVSYGQALGLDASAVIPWRDPKPRVKAIPLLVLVNAAGRVLASWEGASSKADEPKILERISDTITR